jgi:hypothetical protein
MACEAEDDIDQVPMGEHLEHLWGGERAVPTDQEMGPWPVATQASEEPHQAHRVLRTGGPCARAEAGRHPRAGEPFADQQRSIAIVLIIMVITPPQSGGLDGCEQP